MAGSLKTEGIVLRSMRYGEADRILHLYTPHRGRVSAIAKGVRRAKSRFGGRLEPFFRLQLVLYEGRSDLLTVTSAETLAGHRRLREHRAALDTAARACDAVGRLFDDGDPHQGVYHLLANELTLLDATPEKAGRANAARLPPQAAVGGGLRAPALRLRLVRRARAPPGLLRRCRRRGLQRLRGGGVRAGPIRPRLPRRGHRASALRHPGRRAARAGAGGARDQRHGRAPCTRAVAVGRVESRRVADEQWVYDFSEGSKDMRELLGGKGANVAEMTRVLGAERVPAGFTITTEACVAYMKGDQEEPEGMADQVADALKRLEEQAGKTLGDSDDPLLVSVRSGARESMPGMLDTVLNLGMNDESVEGLAKQTENERFAWDSYRRFVQMFGNVARGMPGEAFEDAIKEAKQERGVETDTDLDTDDLKALTQKFKDAYREHTGDDFPQDPQEQLRLAIRAVFDSWTGERAVSYRRLNRIPDDWGTAVNVQQMVFGNKGDESATGVAFSRDEVTGEPEPSGDFLVNAQGEDVVSGVRNTRDIAELKDVMPEAHEQLMDILSELEKHYKDMQDTEFTIEDGQLFMLQTRNAKRPAQAAVRFACDAVDEGLLSKEEALATLDAGALDQLLHPTFDPKADFEVLASGVSASPGAAKGEVVFTAKEAVQAGQDGRDVILVRPFTEADDVAGFHAAKGILTSEGGKASHAALVARGMGRPAVVGASALKIDLGAKTISVNGTTVSEGDFIAIDGTKGCVTTRGRRPDRRARGRVL